MAFGVQDPGALREVVEIREWQQSPDLASDGTTDNYAFVATVRGRFESVGGVTYREGVNAGDMVTHRCIIRHREGIRSSHILIRRGLRYRVIRAAEIQDRRFLSIEAEEVGQHA